MSIENLANRLSDMNKNKTICLRLIILVAAFTAVFYTLLGKTSNMDKLPDGIRIFEILDPPPRCGQWRNHMPRSRAPEVYGAYIEARKLWRSKIEWKLSKSEATRILSDVKAAAEAGDWGARALLASFYREGLGPLPENNVLSPDADKAVAITRTAVAAGQPWGFYDLGVAYEYGYGGAKQSDVIAWAYYRRAAELGSPEAQMALADAYGRAKRPLDEEMMLRCAFEQGHAPAAASLGIISMARGAYADGIKIYQQGVRLGCESCASGMSFIFEEGGGLDPQENTRKNSSN
ncbi:tetratricopeptide repeat protein [Pseudoduganella albidiflava]|uniref:Sel1 repeat family protein n=1 Tax=Pseudoduganella albidiflava TaxID=321983 RepID=A0A411X4J7_9BURK|nr:sel1 repeat family protein [Pseudoduganella albidiflava]QBI03798.1 sel1 repeat family protein [Pseudoduganella albidiflava]GGY61502.1 hypothetical protein GCM10007387_50050 [Pseudoduganella albidiflava]